MENDANVVGRCIGEGSPSYVSFVTKKILEVGEYVLIDFDGKEVLGLITDLGRGLEAITEDITDPKVVERIKKVEGEDFYIRGRIKILGYVDDHLNFIIPKTPPPPGAIIKKADDDILRRIFSFEGSGITIGRLISHPNVEVQIDVNKMVSRHLAILAITGAGKSNAVKIIVDEIMRIGGCPLIFDMHSEYVGCRFENGEVNRIEPKLNPRNIGLGELLTLMKVTEQAHVQAMYMRRAYNAVKDKLRKQASGEVKSYIDMLLAELKSYLPKGYLSEEGEEGEEGKEKTRSKKDVNSIISCINKLEDMRVKYRHILDENYGEIMDYLELGKANVVDLGGVDEDYADVVVSHTLNTILNGRKEYRSSGGVNGLRYPVFIVIEEAHILAPAYRNTHSKYWISRIAREGRKFGVGLCLVSQRPKALDENALSQANNMIILKLVEPHDQSHVQRASETLSEDLLSSLPSLNPGEAIILGMMTRIPALVKINKFEGESIGGDINVVEEWRKNKMSEDEKLDKLKEEEESIYGSGF
ncbi:MAG: helicase HerA domain-containing protein [Candidatus Asgardarchaeia archaeon]